MIIEIHVAPNPPGTDKSTYAHVDAAIAEVQAAGLTYEVGALGTTVEGSPEELWPLFRRVHEATLHAGARSVITSIRIAEVANDDTPRMAALVEPFRE